MGAKQSSVWNTVDGLSPPLESISEEDEERMLTGPRYTSESPPESVVNFSAPIDKGSVDVLLFPFDGETPRIIRMPFDILQNAADIGDNTIYWTYKKRTAISDYVPGDIQFTFVRNDPDDGTPLGRDLEVLHGWSQKQLPLNRCIEHITGGTTLLRWYGNVLVSRAVKTGLVCPGDMAQEFDDVEMDDVEPMISFFQNFSGEKHNELILESNELKIPGRVALKSWECDFQ